MTVSSSRTFVAAVLSMALLSGQAFAGANATRNVAVYTSSAYGYVTDARFGGGSGQYIGCAITGYNYTHDERVYCSARDDQGDFLSCYMYNPPLGIRAAIESISASSSIEIRKDSSNNECQTIYVRNGSSYL